MQTQTPCVMTEQSVEVVGRALARGTGELQEITSLETMDSMTLTAHHQETRVSVPVLTEQTDFAKKLNERAKVLIRKAFTSSL